LIEEKFGNKLFTSVATSYKLLTIGVDFDNNLQASFSRADPKIAKRQW